MRGAVPTRHSHGLTLVELLVAVAIALLLMVASTAAITAARRAHRVAEDYAQMQEHARLALRTIEADLRMAGYWGRLNRAGDIVNAAAPGTAPAGFTSTQVARIDLCGGAGSNWAINLFEYVAGTNNAYGLACAAYQGSPQAGSDSLVVRRVEAADPASLARDRIHLQSGALAGTLFVPQAGCLSPQTPACLPTGYAPQSSETHQLSIHAYYVARRSTQRADLPSLRRKVFGNVNAASVSDSVTDEELVAGIEDLQVRFGIDNDNDGNVDQYGDPGPLPPGAAILAATIWLRVRSEEPDWTEPPAGRFDYADATFTAPRGDRYRRIVVTRTVQLRNALR